MKIILDTHAFIWWDSDPSRLSEIALAACQNPANQLLLSVASVWEMQIKLQLGKLLLLRKLSEMVEDQKRTNKMDLLAVGLEHVLALENLPGHRCDPFDRILIAQAKSEGASLITKDPLIAKYPVDVIW